MGLGVYCAIMGGIGNIPGAMVGGLLLGILEMLGAGYISSTWKDVFVFLILICFSCSGPQGSWGMRKSKRRDMTMAGGLDELTLMS